jgi:hypothetical protein
MAEIGVVGCAQGARDVAAAALARSRSRFATPTVTQPTLLAIVCRMRDEDWAERDAEVRRCAQAELRAPLGSEREPDDTTLERGVRPTAADELTRLVHETMHQTASKRSAV